MVLILPFGPTIQQISPTTVVIIKNLEAIIYFKKFLAFTTTIVEEQFLSYSDIPSSRSN